MRSIPLREATVSRREAQLKEKPQDLECEENCMEGSIKRPCLVIPCPEAASDEPKQSDGKMAS